MLYLHGLYAPLFFIELASLIPRPHPVFQSMFHVSACNIEKLGVAWGRGYELASENALRGIPYIYSLNHVCPFVVVVMVNTKMASSGHVCNQAVTIKRQKKLHFASDHIDTRQDY